ncbi:hypothetical protein [Natrinema limicola]|uniref:hypothetical protein n=1 Tax=Natrinema limicola TaxID=370323 RepID=UPI00126779A2|nr:hypothetical protein [Natrinema limicola]
MGGDISGVVMIGGVCLVFLGHLFATPSRVSNNFPQAKIVSLEEGNALFNGIWNQNELIFGAMILGGISAMESVYERV